MRNVLITIVASIFVYFGLSVPLVYANDTISIKYLINYTFDANGNSHVDQNISLTNKTSKFYTSHYQIILQGESPKNITGHDSSGPLKIESLEISPNTTTIDIDFNDVVVGLNNSLNFVVSYEGLPAKKRGQVWEVTLPRLGEKSQIDDYQLNLTIPQEFGQPAFISPSPIRSVNRTYSFTKDQISRVGVVADFGNFQTFGFSLKYHLSNVSNFPSIKTIVLPPDTNYQRVYYDDLEPVPTVSPDVSPHQKGAIFGTYPSRVLRLVSDADFAEAPERSMSLKNRGRSAVSDESPQTLTLSKAEGSLSPRK